MAQSEATVTVINPTPPTNMSFHNYANSPPTPDASPFVDDGTAGSVTAIAAPLSGAAGEAASTVVVDTDPGQTSISVMGNYTANPSSTHATAIAPSVAPTVVSFVPASPASGAGTVVLTVTGTGYKMNSVVALAGVVQPTIYISATQLRVMNAPKKATAGTVAVTVVTAGTASAATNWTFT